jgi:hypothetical protein
MDSLRIGSGSSCWSFMKLLALSSYPKLI